LSVRHRPLATALLCALIATAAHAADSLDLAQRLVRYNGGVSLLLRNFEPGLAASTAAPDIFHKSFDQAMADNRPVIAAADDQLAHIYATLYSSSQLSAEVGFYESPEGQAIIARNRAPNGAIIWPDPNSMSLSSAESTALTKFNQAIQQRAAIAAQNSQATDQILATESDALIKIRAAAFSDYCKIRDCKAEGIKYPTQ
jgi:hypothetical protein